MQRNLRIWSFFFRAIFEHAEKTLARTPEMLPVLKEAGVVDSGGQGLLEVFRGAFDGYLGKEIDYSAFEKVSSGPGSDQDLPAGRSRYQNLDIVQNLSFV